MKTPALPLLLMSLSISAWAAPTEGVAPSAGRLDVPSAHISREVSRSPTPGSAERFTGNVQIVNLFAAPLPARVTGGQVRFAAGARTAWHTHPLGQTLIVTAGRGRIQFWGAPIQEMKTGDVVSIPPGIKHWHGAAPGSAMTHIAIQEQAEGQTADWLEKVSDAQYGLDADQSPK